VPRSVRRTASPHSPLWGTVPTLHEATEPVDLRDMDRRNPKSPSSTYVTCRTCRTRLPLQPGQMRLTPTHAELSCAACGAQVRVRRSDGEREPEGSIAKAVSLATRLGIAPDEEPASVPHLLWGRRMAPAYASPG